MSEATRLIQAIAAGDPTASDQLLPLVYHELRQLARSHMAQERTSHTLQPTALVHEAYLRLAKDAPPQWDGRGHFFAAAAEAMRRILIEHARHRKSLKRGGGRRRVALDDDPSELASPAARADADDLLAVDEAIDRLTAEYPAKAELVKLLFFAGLTFDEAAAALQTSRSNVYRQWLFARAWLVESMSQT